MGGGCSTASREPKRSRRGRTQAWSHQGAEREERQRPMAYDVDSRRRVQDAVDKEERRGRNREEKKRKRKKRKKGIMDISCL